MVNTFGSDQYNHITELSIRVGKKFDFVFKYQIILVTGACISLPHFFNVA